MDQAHLKDALGINRRDAEKLLADALQHLEKCDGKLVFKRSTSTELEYIFSFCLTNITVRSFLTDHDLWKSFVKVITKNGLVNKFDLPKLQRLRPAVMLFVVSRFHRCVYRTEDGRYVLLCISANEGKISIEASVEITNDQPRDYITNKAIYISLRFFPTELMIDDYCIGKIITKKSRDWHHVYEVTSGRQLARVGTVWPVIK